MKLVCFADTHAGVKNYGKIDKGSGLNEREIQTLKLLNQIIEYSIHNQVDGVIFAGDMYHKNMPSPTLINKVNEIMIKLSKHKIQTFILDGNHDVSKLETTNSGLTQFDTLNIPYFSQSRFYKEELFQCDGKKYKIVFLPTYHTKESIQEYMDALEIDYPTIIIFHGSIKDAELNDWNKMDDNNSIDMSIFKKENIKAVVMGHFHKHQVLNVDPLIFYTGSTNRIDFSEEHQEKGFVELTIHDDEVNGKFIELKDAQKFKTISLNCNNMTKAEEIEKDILDTMRNEDLENTILRIRVEMSENILLNEKRIIEYAYSKHVYYILKIQKILPDIKSIVEDGFNNTLSVCESLKKYYKNQKREKERVELGMKIIQEVEG